MALLVTMAYVSIKTESSIWLLIKLKLEFMVQISPVFILGVHWKRLTGNALLAGILTGTLFTLVMWVGTVAQVWEADLRSPFSISAGVWGLALNYIVIVGVTYISSSKHSTGTS